MNNLLYLHEHKDECPNCMGRGYLNAIYLETSVTGWHLMVEFACRDCNRLDVINYTQSDIEEMAERLTAQDAESDRAEAEERGIPDVDDMGLLRGYEPPREI